MFLCVYQTPISCLTKQDRYRKLAKEHITPARASMRQQEAIFVWGWLTDMQREGEIVTTGDGSVVADLEAPFSPELMSGGAESTVPSGREG